MVFKEGEDVVIIKGADKGKVAVIEGMDGKFLIINIKGKVRKINPRHVK